MRFSMKDVRLRRADAATALLLPVRAGMQGAEDLEDTADPADRADPEDPEDRVAPGDRVAPEENRAAGMNCTVPNAAENIPTREPLFVRTALAGQAWWGGLWALLKNTA